MSKAKELARELYDVFLPCYYYRNGNTKHDIKGAIMSKAKELAREMYSNIGYGRGVDELEILRLVEAVIESEPEPEPLRGWIECTSTFYDNDRVVLINTRDISSIYIVNDPKDYVLNAKTGICLRRAEEVYFVKESYDEIKQKIREAS